MRQDGYYWVKITFEWRIARYFSDYGHWFITGTSEVFSDSDFEEIDEKPILKDEQAGTSGG